MIEQQYGGIGVVVGEPPELLIEGDGFIGEILGFGTRNLTLGHLLNRRQPTKQGYKPLMELDSSIVLDNALYQIK